MSVRNFLTPFVAAGAVLILIEITFLIYGAYLTLLLLSTVVAINVYTSWVKYIKDRN